MKTNFLSLWALLIVLALQAMAVRAELPDFTQLVEKYSPAVVNISTTQKKESRGHPDIQIPGIPNEQFGDLFRKFFENRPDLFPDDFDAQSMGSGFIVSADGYVLTNAHVIEDADEILVKLYDRRELVAKVIGSDEKTDIALLKIDAKNLPTVKIGSSQDLKVGAWVMAIGNPFGFDHTVTAGIVSAKGRSFHNENYVPFIQTDVAINPGNSGGPLFNIKGEVVGVNSRISSEPGRRSYAGLSFAIPAEVARDVMLQLKEKGHVSRGWLGVMIQDVTPELAQSFGLQRPQGALVARVLEGSPAESGKVEVGDVILKFNGTVLRTSSELPPLVGSLRAGEIVSLEIMRNGSVKTLPIKIGELPEEPLADHQSDSMPVTPPTLTSTRLGLNLQELNDKIRADRGTQYGVMVSEVHEGPAQGIGLRKGDIIQVINNRKVTSIQVFNDIVASIEAGRSVAILVHRDSGPVFLALRLPE